MSYIQKINELIETTILKNTTSKILQHMGRIRNASSLNQARRWVMELIQNAQDVSFEEGIRIRITLTDDNLTFAHTGKPFRVKDILSIINQASSKDESIETVGKFGTGFVTTFQLSESVTLRSVLFDEGEKHIPFEIVLDRSGRTDEEIQKSIVMSMDQLRGWVSEEKGMDYQPEAYNTSFVYSLTGDYERQIAHTGITDLENTINEILAFSDKILEICVVIDTREEKKTITYMAEGEEILSRTDGIFQRKVLWKYLVEDTEITRENNVIYLTEDKLTLAVMTDQERNLIRIDENKARIFIRFPLVGTEQFPFPVIVNAQELHPNELRSGITLVDGERSDEAQDNKRIMDKAVCLYKKLLCFLVKNNYGKIWNVIEIPLWQEHAEMSESWVSAHIYDELYRIIAKEEIIETDQGMKALWEPKLRFVRADSQTEKEDVYWLIVKQQKYYTAKHEVNWPEILKGYCEKQDKIYEIGLENIIKNIKPILRSFPDARDAMEWLNRLYRSCMKIEGYRVQIRSGEVGIYPSQYPNEFQEYRTVYTHLDVKEDQITDALLREISESFLGYRSMEEYRKKLVAQEFELEKGDLESFTDENVAELIRHFTNSVIHNYKMDSLEERIQIGCAKLAEWIESSLEKDDKAKMYFPEYCSDEGRAKLLTSKAVAALSRNLRDTMQKLADTEKELKDRELEMIKLRERIARQENCQEQDSFSNDVFLNDAWFTQEELESYGGEAEDFGRMVGTAGELFAFEKLKAMFEDKNVQEQIGEFRNDLFDQQLTYEVIRPDTEQYKQAGFDIAIYGKNEVGTIITEDYFEVKTHTTKSVVKNTLHFSEEQMKYAMRKGKNYHALLVSYDAAGGKCIGIHVYHNVIAQIIGGELKHAECGYCYNI